MAQQQPSIRSVNIAPTPVGCRQMKRLFLATKGESAQKITDAEEMKEHLEYEVDHSRLPHGEKGYILINDALDALIAQEYQRIASMEEGIAELERCGY